MQVIGHMALQRTATSSVPNRPEAPWGPAGGLPRTLDGTGRLAVVRPVLTLPGVVRPSTPKKTDYGLDGWEHWLLGIQQWLVLCTSNATEYRRSLSYHTLLQMQELAHSECIGFRDN